MLPILQTQTTLCSLCFVCARARCVCVCVLLLLLAVILLVTLELSLRRDSDNWYQELAKAETSKGVVI